MAHQFRTTRHSMPHSEDQQDGPLADGFDTLRHDLMNPLTTIRGRAQLLTRAVERSLGLDDDERVRLLRGLAAIDHAVIAAVGVLDHAESHQEGQASTRERSGQTQAPS